MQPKSNLAGYPTIIASYLVSQVDKSPRGNIYPRSENRERERKAASHPTTFQAFEETDPHPRSTWTRVQPHLIDGCAGYPVRFGRGQRKVVIGVERSASTHTPSPSVPFPKAIPPSSWRHSSHLCGMGWSGGHYMAISNYNVTLWGPWSSSDCNR